MSDEAFREARSLLVERDPEQIGRGLALTSIKDATWVHQRHALLQGYNSILELAIDELAEQIAALKARVDALEARLG
jgi:uncharacterized small protein (DUF1192 family)